jgi:hypothetical protein
MRMQCERTDTIVNAGTGKSSPPLLGARTGDLCAAPMSVDAVYDAVLSLYYRSQLASTPFPFEFLPLFLGISIF